MVCKRGRKRKRFLPTAGCPTTSSMTLMSLKNVVRIDDKKKNNHLPSQEVVKVIFCHAIQPQNP